MGIREQAAAEIQAAEYRLRGILKEHIDTAAFEDIIWLSQLAERLKALVPAGGSQGEGGKPVSSVPGPILPPPALQGKRTRQEYPKFEIRGDVLIKTGWSKKAKREYVHRAPLAVLEAVKQRIAAVAKTKPLFTMEDVMPIPSPDGDGEVPDYQVYVCVAYLVDEGQLKRQGRQGYGIGMG